MALESSYSQAGVIPVNTVVYGPIDADDQRGFSLQIKSIGSSGVLQVHQSLDGTTWQTTAMNNVNGGLVVTTLSTAGMFWTNLTGRYVRVMLTNATTAGSTDVRVRTDVREYSELTAGMTVACSSLPSLPAGVSVIGGVVAQVSTAQGPTLLYHKLPTCAASTNATSVKTSVGRVLRIIASGGATGRYLKLYNKASAPTVGTDVPILTFWIRANTDIDINVSDIGLNFSTGIAYAITGGPTDADTVAAAAGDVVGLNIIYI